jgi:Flp pilus assembly pilin Flp
VISRIKNLAMSLAARYWNPVPPRELLQELREDDRGMMSTEMVIIVAVVTVFTLGVITFIGAQILNKAHGINF